LQRVVRRVSFLKPFERSTMQEHIDPWAMQRELMAASGQALPKTPELNKGVLLYAALNLEECQETLRALAKALRRLETLSPLSPLLALGALAERLQLAALQMHEHSLSIRNTLKTLPDDFRAELLPEEVVEMADGTTDLTVTNCGFALSLGLNGAACYKEVAESNLSKRNPDTGLIEKTPDGKWIKGRNYREPELAKVIFAQES
jgi:predicted HAD superfamily Cof-like phosphohydrolase